MSCVRQLLIFILVPPLQLQQLCEQTVALKAAEAEVLKMMRGRFLTWSCSIAEVLKRFWCCGAFFSPLACCSALRRSLKSDWTGFRTRRSFICPAAGGLLVLARGPVCVPKVVVDVNMVVMFPSLTCSLGRAASFESERWREGG